MYTNFFGLLVSAVVVLGFIFFYFFYLPIDPKISNTQDMIPESKAYVISTQKTDNMDLAGKIYFADTGITTERSFLSVFDLESGTRGSLDPLDQELDLYYERSVIKDHDANRLYYLSSPYEPNEEWLYPYIEFLSLTIRDIVEGTIVRYPMNIGNAHALSMRPKGLFPNEFAFALVGAHSDLTEEDLQAANMSLEDMRRWSIYLLDAEGVTLYEIEHATASQWDATGRYLVYIKKDGIYRLDTNDMTHTLLYGSSNNLIDFHSAIAVTDDFSLYLVNGWSRGIWKMPNLQSVDSPKYDITTMSLLYTDFGYPDRVWLIGEAQDILLAQAPQSQGSRLYAIDVGTGDYIQVLDVVNAVPHMIEPYWVMP